MNIYKTAWKALSVMAFLFAFVQSSYGQCTPTYSGNPCVGDPIQFFGNAVGATNHNWDFNAEGSSVQDKPAFTFNTPGLKTIKYTCKLSNGSNCSGEVKIDVKPKPTINVQLLNQPTQCFKGNQFCFTDSSKSGDPAAGIVNIKYVFSDGELIEVNGTCSSPVSMPRSFCKTYTDPSGGVFTVTVEITDCNGCVRRLKLPITMTVRASAGLAFSSNKPKGCDSVLMKIVNTSVVDKNDLVSWEWDFGDGTKNTTDWKDTVKHWYYIQGPNNGDFNTKLTVTTKDGCTESLIFTGSATNFIIKPIILADKDSTCISEPEIKFRLKDGPVTGATGFLWNFGDPPTGPLNVNNQSWAPAHKFSGLGPYQVKLTFQHPICGARSVFDTVLIIGPVSTIEIPGNRVVDKEKFQCYITDSIHFPNNSGFYHNDDNEWNDDSTIATTSGFDKPFRHIFDNAQTSVKAVPQIRTNTNVERLWDFDDDYCEKCTTDTKNGINVGINCKYTRDSLPVHWYTPWDSVYMTTFSTRAVNVALFDKTSGLCFTKRMFPSDSMAIIRDTILYYGDNPMGLSGKDSSIYASISKKQKVGKELVGKSSTVFKDGARFYIPTLDTAYLDANNGTAQVRHIGPKFLDVPKGYSIVLKSKTDKAVYHVWPVYIQDTIAKNLLKPSQKLWKMEKMQGYNAGDSIDPDGHRSDFYKTTPRCFNVRLKHKDLVHPLACEHEATLQLVLMPASAKRLRKDGVQCLGSDQDNYGITFILDDTKPGCSMSVSYINPDTATDPNDWRLAGTLLGGGAVQTGQLPGNPPIIFPYQISGNPPNQYSMRYNADMIKDTIDGYVHVGLIVGNGIDPVTGQPAACLDTVYYNRFARFPILDNRFDIASPKPGPEYTKICRKDSISLALSPLNKSNMRDVEQVRYSLAAANVGPDYNKYYTLSVDEYYKRFQKVAGKPYLSNQLIVNRNSFYDGVDVPMGADTIETARVHKWHQEADVTPVFNDIKRALERSGFDIYEMTPAQIAEIIWNGVGTFGDPSTGSRGCLDTTGLGRKIRFTMVADSIEILHYRDTSLHPIDHRIIDGVNRPVYTFVPQWSGFYIANMEVLGSGCTKRSGTAKRVIVGFYTKIDYSDTIICHGTPITATPQFRYFEVYPEITFRLLDPTDYWRDRLAEAGQPNREGLTRWDLSKDDDNPANPLTMFGGAPYSVTGMGNPDITLSSSLYYQDSGFYIVRVAAMDSTGCKDTLPQNLYVTRVKAMFDLNQTIPQCNTVIEMFDSSKIFDPCIRKTGSNCDRIVKWWVDWGDGVKNFFPVWPAKVGHVYTRNDTFRIWLKVETALGCIDSVYKDVIIPGPEPEYETLTSRVICAGDKVVFRNISRHASTSAIWQWSWGDGLFSTTSSMTPDTLTHVFKNPGTYDVYVDEYDSLPKEKKYCSARFPDTTYGQQQKITITVLPYDSVWLSPDTIICPGESVTFKGGVNNQKYTNFVWQFGEIPGDTTVTPNTTETHIYAKDSGEYIVKFQPDANLPGGPHCPGIDSVKVIISKVVADFNIDSTKKPVFCFTNVSKYQSKSNWLFYSKTDITAPPKGVMDGSSEQNDAYFCKDYRDSLGTYYVCLEAVNDNDCRDTVCKVVVNDFFAFIKPPNIFTPGNKNTGATDDEGVYTDNDVFNILIKGEVKYELDIFDRWGVKVFSSTSKDKDWNGKVNNTGAECADGTYFYILKYKYKGKDKDEPILNGVVTLIREK